MQNQVEIQVEIQQDWVEQQQNDVELGRMMSIEQGRRIQENWVEQQNDVELGRRNITSRIGQNSSRMMQNWVEIIIVELGRIAVELGRIGVELEQQQVEQQQNDIELAKFGGT